MTDISYFIYISLKIRSKMFPR